MPQLSNDLDSVSTGKADVKDEQVRRAVERAAQPGIAVASRADGKPLLPEHAAKQRDDVPAVLDNENGWTLTVCLHRALKISDGTGPASAGVSLGLRFHEPRSPLESLLSRGLFTACKGTR